VTRCLALVVGLICSLPAPAAPAELDVQIADARGAPVADAVVTAVPHAGSPPPSGQSRLHVIDQKNETFIPYIEVFRPGDRVIFHNSDTTRHHAYSFAPARQFEFVLAPGESSAPLQLDQVGVIAVGCNIHDQMITYFYVTDAPFVARSASDGRAHVDLPAGSFDVRVWHPRQRPGSRDNAQTFAAAAGSAPATLQYTLTLLPDQRSSPDRERSTY
jgi:plastocyanin